MALRMAGPASFSLVVALVCGTAATRGASAADSVQAMIDAHELQGAYNPVLLSYLTEEGRAELSEAQRKAVLEQLVAGSRQQAKITPGAQATAAVATLAGLLTKGTVSQGISESAAQVWSQWVDASFVLQKAGYKDESSAFFENCIQNFPYDELRARCAGCRHRYQTERPAS